MISRLDERRRREWALVVVSLLLLLLTSTNVARLMVEAWETEGLIYYVWWTTVVTTEITSELAITLPAGVLVGWLLLFAIDEYKRVQAVLLCLVVAPAFLVTVLRLEQWTWMSPISALPGLLIGGVLGVITGAIGGQSSLAGRGRWTFPTAAKALSVSIAVGSVIAFLERYVQYRIPVDPQAPWIPSVLGTGPTSTPPGAVTAALDVASVLVLVVVVNYFVQYSDRKDIVLVCPDDRTLVELLGGMYNVARRKYDGKTVAGRRVLNDAAAAVSEAQLPEPSGPLAFQYRLPGPLKRRTIVSADRARQLSERDVDRAEEQARERATPAKRYLYSLWDYLRRLVPQRVRTGFSPYHRSTLQQIERADVVLLVAPLSDFVDEYQLRNEPFEEYTDVIRKGTTYLDEYERICRAYQGTRPDVYVVTPEGELAQQLYRAEYGKLPSINDPQFTTFVANTVLDVTMPCDLLPVRRPFNDDDDEHGGTGFDYLLSKM